MYKLLRYALPILLLTGMSIFGCSDNEPAESEQGVVTIELHDLQSSIRGEDVPTSVILPPDFDPQGEPLPLLIYLHGAGGTRDELTDYLPMFLQRTIDEGALPPLVMVGFSSDPFGLYVGWEEFVVGELPRWMHERYGTRLDRDGTVLIGPSMGG
jgi:enterochelin esterase-like enzyme|tara:strand:- start:1136 stop:1600 length:465 start_codon:yes stop_codon:yes gene_type:complete